VEVVEAEVVQLSMCHPKTRDFRPKLQKEQREREKKTNSRILIRETSRLSEQLLRITKNSKF
jgi:hypothetical protein